MNMISIHLNKVEVRPGRDNPFQVFSLLRAYFLVSWVAHPFTLQRHGRASRRQSNFPWRSLYLLLFSYM